MQKKAAIGTVLVLIALVMVGISLTMPWYNRELTAEDQGSSESIKGEWFLDRGKETIKGETFGTQIEISIELDYDNDTLKDKKTPVNNFSPVSV